MASSNNQEKGDKSDRERSIRKQSSKKPISSQKVVTPTSSVPSPISSFFSKSILSSVSKFASSATSSSPVPVTTSTAGTTTTTTTTSSTATSVATASTCKSSAPSASSSTTSVPTASSSSPTPSSSSSSTHTPPATSSPKKSYFASVLAQVKNVMESETVRNLVISVQNKVQEFDTAIGETVIPALIASRPRSPEVESKKKEASGKSRSDPKEKIKLTVKSSRKSIVMEQLAESFQLKPNQVHFESKPESAFEPTWPIRMDVHSRMEKIRRAQSIKCREIVRIDVSQFNASIQKLGGRAVAPVYSSSHLAHGLIRGPIDTLTDYELKEVLRRLPLADKFRLIRVNKRWRSLLQQSIKEDYSIALVSSTFSAAYRSMSALAMDYHLPVLPSASTVQPLPATALSNVSRRTKSSSATHLVWVAVHQPIRVHANRLENSVADWLRKYVGSLQLLAIASPIESNVFKSMIEQRMLTTLWLTGTHFVNLNLLALPDYTMNLQYLWLHQCAVDDEGLRVVARECFRLNHLRLSECDTVRGAFCAFLPRTIQQFEVYNCRMLSNETWQTFMQTDRKPLISISAEHCYLDNNLFQGISKCDKLQRIRLRLTNQAAGPPADAATGEKGSTPSNLSSSSSSSSTETNLKLNCLRNLPRLESLIIRDHFSPPILTNSVFSDIQRGCDRLLHIEIELPEPSVGATSLSTALTDTAFEQLPDNCPKLHSLTLINCVQLTAATLSSLSNLKLLKQLMLVNASFDDKVLQQHFPTYRALSRLKLLRCSSVTDAFVRFVFTQIEQRNVWFFFTIGSNPQIRREVARQLTTPKTMVFTMLD